MANVGIQIISEIIVREYAKNGEFSNEFIDLLFDRYNFDRVVYCFKKWSADNNIELEFLDEDEEEEEPQPVLPIIVEEPIIKSNIKFAKTTKFNEIDVEKMIYTSINDKSYSLFEIKQQIVNFSKSKMLNMLNKFENICEQLEKRKTRQIEIFKINGLYY